MGVRWIGGRWRARRAALATACLVLACCVLACGLGGCGSNDGQSAQGGAGTTGVVLGAPPGTAGDLPCDVAAVVQQHCEHCHGLTLRTGAPMMLMHASDFAALRNGVQVGQTALLRVQDDARPMPPPPDPRLSPAEIATLAQWVNAGVPAAAGGCAILSSAPSGAAGSGVGSGGSGGSMGASGTGGTGGGGAGEGSAAGSGSTVPPAPGGGWTMFGHDLGNSRDNPDESVLSPDNVASLHQVWAHDGAGTTCAPAIVDGIVYVTEWDGSVHALHLQDGSELWTTPLPDLIDSSPAVTATHVYVGDDAGSVHALDRTTGREEWSKRVDAHAETHLWSSPVVIEEENLLVIGVASGEESLPAPHTFRGSVVALDLADGHIVWQLYTTDGDANSGPGVAVWGTPTVDTTRKLVYVGTGNNYEKPASKYADSMLAIDYRTGMLAWSNQFTADDIFVVGFGATGPDADIGSTANLFSAGGKDLLGIGIKSGLYYALDRDTGMMQWMTMITEGAVLGGVISASAYADGTLFVASNRYQMGATRTVALDATTGMVKWEHSAPMITYGGVAHANGVTYVGTTNGTLYALDASDGKELWSVDMPDAIAGSPTVANGMLLVPWGYQWTLRQGEAGTGGLVAYGL